MTKRYAIYFTLPQTDPVYQTAIKWLGYDAYSGNKTNTDSKKLAKNRQYVSKAAKYGFHATLKPPFRLSQDKSEEQLIDELENFASSITAFTCKPLKIKSMTHFIALAPKNSCDQLDAFAAQCLKHFEPFRAQLTREEYQKRNPVLLSERQLRYLEQWGYPYVEDEFRFHMTLTDSMMEDEIKKIKKKLKQYFKEVLGKPLQINQLHIFRQDSTCSNFQIISSHNLKPI